MNLHLRGSVTIYCNMLNCEVNFTTRKFVNVLTIILLKRELTLTTLNLPIQLDKNKTRLLTTDINRQYRDRSLYCDKMIPAIFTLSL